MPKRPATFRPAHLGSADDAARAVEADRGTARERGYDGRWDREAREYRREHPLCLGCEAVGRVAPAEVVDHVEPHRGDMVKFWDKRNWQSCCQWHHNVVKQQLEAMRARRVIDVASLRLDSKAAQRLTRQLMPGPSR